MAISDLGIQRPSLDDVFLELPGRAASAEGNENGGDAPPGGAGSRRSRRARRSAQAQEAGR